MTDLTRLIAATDKLLETAETHHQNATTLKDRHYWHQRKHRLARYYDFLTLLREFHPDYRNESD